jgi:3-oxoacyl-[acyl-carrier-protein] synthase II
VGGFSTIAEAVRTTDGKGPQRLSPFTVPAFLANLASGQVSIRHQLKGPLGAPVTACAASIQAIGDAARLIRNDEADMALCGGSEATIDRVALGSFAAAKAVTTFCGGDPAKLPDLSIRHGTVLSWPKVLACWCWRHWIMHWRGRQPLAEVVGCGTSADAYHVTSGPEDGSGAARSMRAALRQAQLHS